MIKWIDRVAGIACSLVKRIKRVKLQSKEVKFKLTKKITAGLPKGSNSYGNGSAIVPVNNCNCLYRTGNTVARGRAEVKLILRRNYSGTGCTNNSVKKLNNLIQRCKDKANKTSSVDRPLY